MYKFVKWASKFKKDYRRAMKRGCNMDKLDEILLLLESGGPLPPELGDHQLVGNMGEFRELHVAPDWLLVYGNTNRTLTFVRTGTHADIFG